MSAWLFLALAISFEIAGTFFLKLSNGFEKLSFGLLSILFFCACFGVLAPAMKELPVGVVYGVWAGAGIVAATIIGLFAFNEQLSLLQVAFIILILIGTVGLNVTTNQ